MRPPISMVLFTTLAGAGQGLLLALAGVQAAQGLGLVQAPTALFVAGAIGVLLLSGAGLVAASFHLGRPLRAWRAAAMWRTSWLSREVIVLPAFVASTAAWGAAQALQAAPGTLAVLAALASALALLLYLCTAMIYGAVKVIREWATPLTPLNYTLLGLASGTLAAAALAAALAPPLLPGLAGVALALTLLGAATRGASLWRNLHLVPKTTLQSAIGVRHPQIRQTAQGAMGGSFATREFFHGRSAGFVHGMRWAAAGLAFLLPAAVLLLAGARAPAVLLAALFVLQWLGLLAERWSFFAEARHPQNLYHGPAGR
jgi:DMSO reductase anchor subunit